MSVILNEVALHALLETQEGLVGRDMQRRAELVVDQAQQNVRGYFASAPSLNVDQDVGFTMAGSTAVVGIQDAGRKSRRLAAAQRDGKVNWLVPALEAATD